MAKMVLVLMALMGVFGFKSVAEVTIGEAEPRVLELTITEGDVSVTATQLDKGSFDTITVKAGALSRTFDWQNVDNPAYSPAVHIADVNGDNREEAVILLTTGTGTGVHIEELHVLSLEDLTELEAEDPVRYVNSHVTSSVTAADGKVQVSAEYDSQKVELSYEKSDAGYWFEKVSFHSFVDYELLDNKIVATVAGNVSPAEFAVAAVMEYGPDLTVSSLTLTAME